MPAFKAIDRVHKEARVFTICKFNLRIYNINILDRRAS